jgi:polyhydroxyalkanoate synthase
MLKHNQLRTGTVALGSHEIDLAAIRLPVLVFAGNTDGIAPIGAVKALIPLLPNAREVRFEIVPGGHLGMLTGRAARRTTWVVMDEWISAYSTPDERETPADSSRTTTKKATAKKAAAKRRTAKKATAKKATAKKSGATDTSERSAIGSNPERRFGSEASRGLARKR